MVHAYTPGLKILGQTRVLRERRLPLKGEVLVAEGKTVSPAEIVAQTELPGGVQMVNVANHLNIEPSAVEAYMVVGEGDVVQAGQTLAETKGLFGLFKSAVEAPVAGTVESISAITGQVALREAPIPVNIDAYMGGKVAELIPGEGVVVANEAVLIQGIFGIGGERRGKLEIVAASREAEITAAMIEPGMQDRILVGGALITLEAFQKAIELGIAGVVVGGFNYQDLTPVLGYPLGVAITGSEEITTALMVTEGYGRIPMGQRTYDLLQSQAGRLAAMNGATQIRAGVIRPEIVIPLTPSEATADQREIPSTHGLEKGNLVRAIRAPYFGRIGTVVGFPPELEEMESESKVRVAVVEINGERITLPRANLELVETD